MPPPCHLLDKRSEGLTHSHSYSFTLFQLESPLHPSFQVIRHGCRPVHDGDGPTAAAILAPSASILLEQPVVVRSEEKNGLIQFCGQVHLGIRQSTSCLGYRTGYNWRLPTRPGWSGTRAWSDALVCDDRSHSHSAHTKPLSDGTQDGLICLHSN
jgi:hypothetical protein